MKDSERKPTILECVLFGIFSLIPLLGLLVAVISVIFGVAKLRVDGWKLILIGVVGILSTHFSYPWLGSKFTVRDLHRCVTAIEFYKQVHGQYPKELKDLNEGKTGLENDKTLIHDNDRGIGFFGRVPPYYYELLQDGTGYYLFSVGPDQKPFTSDDIYPNLTSEEISHSGYRKKNLSNIP